jgi:uncharacterized membrane protein
MKRSFSGRESFLNKCFLYSAALFAANEVTRRFKWIGFTAFVVLPVILTVMWFTVFAGTAYKDWFHLVKVYSSNAGCIIFWCIRFVGGTREMRDNSALLFDHY